MQEMWVKVLLVNYYGYSEKHLENKHKEKENTIRKNTV